MTRSATGVRYLIVATALLTGAATVAALVMIVAGLWSGGGWRALVGAAAVVWLFAVLVIRATRYVERKGWL